MRLRKRVKILEDETTLLLLNYNMDEIDCLLGGLQSQIDEINARICSYQNDINDIKENIETITNLYKKLMKKQNKETTTKKTGKKGE